MQKPQDDGQEHRGGWRLAVWVLGLLIAIALFGGISSRVALAQDAPTAREVTPDDVNAVAREIWCPLCSGVRLDACELKACEQMKEVIAIKLAEGEDTASIKAYFVEQYGPEVMGEPPRQGFNWLAWILPAVAAVAGGYFFWRTTHRMMQPSAPLQPPAGFEPSATMPVRLAPDDLQRQADEALSEEDEYTQKLDEELAKYG
jgi:cytochrome c-type biogenesis protein CcmH